MHWQSPFGEALADDARAVDLGPWATLQQSSAQSSKTPPDASPQNAFLRQVPGDYGTHGLSC